MLNKKLLSEIEDKEEIIEQFSDLKSKSESQKVKKSADKKEISALTKQHKIEIQKLQEDIKRIKENWTSPDQLKKILAKEKQLESQIKSLKEDLARKRDLVSSLKESHEKAEKDITEVVAQVTNESKKEDLDKISKLSKELNRKDNMIKDLKSMVDELKDKENSADSEAKSALSKLKSIKADLLRKEAMIKELKDKLESTQQEIKVGSENMIESSKHKEIIRKYKQEIERKDLKISSLESKLNTNTSELDKLRESTVKEAKTKKSEYSSQSKKYDSVVKKAKEAEEVTQTCTIVIRRMIKEMIITVEKLRSEVTIAHHEISAKSSKHSSVRYDSKPSGHNTPIGTPVPEQTAISDIYKESLDILGVSLNELTEFVQPDASFSNLPMYEYTNEGTVANSDMKKSMGPGLQFEDLNIPASNKDLDVFTAALEAIVDDPSQLITESEDIIRIFKKLLLEIVQLETNLNVKRSYQDSSKI